MDVLRRDGNLFVGLLVPSVVEGELDRQWNSKCFRDLSWYWATTAGTLMCGDQITKTLPTNKVPVFHANAGYLAHICITSDHEPEKRMLHPKQATRFRV